MNINYRFACVVVLYNPEEDIKQQLKTYSECFKKLFLFDNSPKKAQWLESLTEIENVCYIGNGENLGLSEAFNITFQKSYEEGFDFITTMDQDTVFEKEEILKMFKHISECEDDSVAIFATNFRKIYFGKNGPEYSKKIYPENDVIEERFHIQSGNFLKISLMKNVFPLDNFFVSFVDFDMDYSAYIKGYKLLVYGDCLITQQIGEPIKASFLAKHGFTNMSVNRYYYLMRNNLYFGKKYKDYKEVRKRARYGRRIFALKILLSEKNKIAKIKMMKKGYKDYKNGVLGGMTE